MQKVPVKFLPDTRKVVRARMELNLGTRVEQCDEILNLYEKILEETYRLFFKVVKEKAGIDVVIPGRVIYLVHYRIPYLNLNCLATWREEDSIYLVYDVPSVFLYVTLFYSGVDRVREIQPDLAETLDKLCRLLDRYTACSYLYISWHPDVRSVCEHMLGEELANVLMGLHIYLLEVGGALTDPWGGKYGSARKIVKILGSVCEEAYTTLDPLVRLFIRYGKRIVK